MDTASKKKRLSESSLRQIQILTALAHTSGATGDAKRFQLQEIAEGSGIRDEKEVQRYLFILEGQKLVTPYPSGDFTSRVWHITRPGLDALRQINSSLAA